MTCIPLPSPARARSSGVFIPECWGVQAFRSLARAQNERERTQQQRPGKMSVRPSTAPPVQDMPPAGGFRKVDMSRYLSKAGIDRGPKGWQLWAGSVLIISYGYYRIGQYNIEKNQQKMQERKVRYALAPVLQAEADREYMMRENANLAKEAEVMKDVPGWKVGMSPYFSGKWMPRAIAQLDRSTK